MRKTANPPLPPVVGPFTERDMRRALGKVRAAAAGRAVRAAADGQARPDDTERLRAFRARMRVEAAECDAMVAAINHAEQQPNRWPASRILAMLALHHPRMAARLGRDIGGAAMALCRGDDDETDHEAAQLVRDYRTYLHQGCQDGQRQIIVERYGVDVRDTRFGLVARHVQAINLRGQARAGAEQGAAEWAARAVLLRRNQQPVVLLPDGEHDTHDREVRDRIVHQVNIVAASRGPVRPDVGNYQAIQQILARDLDDDVPAAYTFADLARRFPAETTDLARAAGDQDTVTGQLNLSREGWKATMHDRIGPSPTMRHQHDRNRRVHVAAGNPHTGMDAAPIRTRLRWTFAIIAAIHAVAVTFLLVGVLSAGTAAITLGAAAVAYGRGALHAMDFDHVSVVDNTTRQFLANRRHSTSIGLAFSAGHSTVVVAAGVLIVASSRWAAGMLDADSGPVHALAVFGAAFSGLYLLMVGASNIANFNAARHLHRRLRANPGMPVPDDALAPRGLSARLLTAPLRRVSRPRHIYGVGLLFGLGFDTASLIALLIVTTAAAAGGASVFALLSFPLLFASAMTLGDTCNGLLMLRMYGTAVADPGRKVVYNMVVTGLSVLSASAVAVLAAAGLLADEAGWHNPIVDGVAAIDTSYAGFGLAGLFVVIGGFAWLRWRMLRHRPTVAAA